MTYSEFRDFLDRNNEASFTDGIDTIDGIKVAVETESKSYNEDLVQFLYVLGTELKAYRNGYKDISYDRWVDNVWYSWEIVYDC